MRRRWIAALVVASLLVVSPGASADPSNWGQLAQIILWLERIDQTLRDVNDTVDGIKQTVATVYPDGALRTIQTLFELELSRRQTATTLSI